MTWNLTTDAPDFAGTGLRAGAWPAAAVARLRQDGLITDANETILFTRQLEHIESEILRAQYPDVIYPQIVDTKVNGLDPTDRVYTWREQDGTARWQEKGNNRQNDLESASIRRGENSVHFYSFVSEYGYDFQELRTATRLGVNLDAEYGALVRGGWERLVEQIVATGYGSTTLKGILNQSAVNVETEGAALHTLTAGALLTRLKAIISAKIVAQKSIAGLMPNRFLVYPALYEAMVNKHMDTTTHINTRSVMQEFMAYLTSRGMSDFVVIPWRFTEAAGDSGKHRLVLYRKSPEIVTNIVSVPFEQLPPFRSKWGWDVPCHGRTAGVVVKQPAGVEYIDSPTA